MKKTKTRKRRDTHVKSPESPPPAPIPQPQAATVIVVYPSDRPSLRRFMDVDSWFREPIDLIQQPAYPENAESAEVRRIVLSSNRCIMSETELMGWVALFRASDARLVHQWGSHRQWSEDVARAAIRALITTILADHHLLLALADKPAYNDMSNARFIRYILQTLSAISRVPPLASPPTVDEGASVDNSNVVAGDVRTLLIHHMGAGVAGRLEYNTHTRKAVLIKE